MPIYEYRCESCGEELEKIQKMSDPPLRDCPCCGREALIKLVSASSFRLKGSGWYETDFKNKPKPPADKEAGEETGKEAGKDEGGKAGEGKPGDGKQKEGAEKQRGEGKAGQADPAKVHGGANGRAAAER